MLEALSGTTDKIYINAYYIRNKSNKNNTTLEQLSEEKRVGDPYSILDKIIKTSSKIAITISQKI